MNTAEILKTPNRYLHPVKRFLAGAFVALCATLGAHAQSTFVYSINIVGCVPDRTVILLTAQLTPLQRQAFHAETFNRLPSSARATYLRVAAYAVGIMVGSNGQSLSSAALAEYMQTASVVGLPDFNQFAPSPDLLAHKAVVKEAMQELNVLIASQLANNSAYQQTMDAGAVDSFFDTEMLSLD